eukprot:COSAG06_NODE_33408_length_490_cov_1.063939_1_plen_101_part_01
MERSGYQEAVSQARANEQTVCVCVRVSECSSWGTGLERPRADLLPVSQALGILPLLSSTHHAEARASKSSQLILLRHRPSQRRPKVTVSYACLHEQPQCHV